MIQTFDKRRLMIVVCLFVATAALVSGRVEVLPVLAVEQAETRCGWFSNPTPSNASLYDRSGEWIIAEQGGYQADGDWPAFGAKQWVETNVHYGHGCACLRLRVNRETHKVIAIESGRARPLSVCRRDRSLKKWGFK